MSVVRLGAVASVAAALSCGTPDMSLDIDAAFAPAERDAIIHAADEWNERTHSSDRQRFTLDEPGSWRVERGIPPNGWMGARYPRSQRIVIHPNANMRRVALHEMGHALGLGHVSPGIMDPDSDHDTFTDADMAECRRVGACP